MLGTLCISTGCVIEPGTLPGTTGTTGTSLPTTGTTGTGLPGTGVPSVGDASLPSTTSSDSTSSSGPTGPSDTSGTSQPAPVEDAFLWLEETESPRSMSWVKDQNKQTEDELTKLPSFAATKKTLTTILESSARIPEVNKIGDHVFNFWKDKAHPRGIWRKTTLESYRSKSPKWETVLDIDALAKQENENWVWKKADCLTGAGTRCMLVLSRGGKDAVVHREFDVKTGAFVTDGFFLPEAKGRISWVNENQLLVGTKVGDNSTTKSGYPRQIRRWTRGTKIEDAPIAFEAQASDNVVRAYHSDSQGVSRDYVHRLISRFENEFYLLDANNKKTKLEVPSTCRLHFWGPWMIIELKSDWEVGGKTWPQGSILVTDQDKFVAGARELTALFTPTKTRSFQGIAKTKKHLLLTEMEDVKGRLREWSYSKDKGWTGRDVKVPDSGSFTVKSYDENSENFYSISYSDYLTPTTLYWARSGTDLREELYALPPAFNASDLEVKQYFVTSQDGTRVPYFQVSKKGLKLDQSHPTLLYGYGGFQISIKPRYLPMEGAGWLEKGGVYVVANIRGGGEYGPAWHQAALREKRPRAFEDFVAVAQDLVQRKVTQAKHLGVLGRSNGGLLTGVMLTRHPELWGAVVSQVPLLDMKRYHKLLAGALWKGEYGDPDVPADWAYLSKYSPYQNIVPGQTLPPSLFTTSTKDDRVHPAHARKMVAQLKAQGYTQAKLYENTEGGHGGTANAQQTAHLNALVFTFLGQALGLAPKG